MVKRKFRLPLPLRRAREIAVPDYIVKYAKNGVGHNRYGVLIRKNVAKKSVARNSLKRRIIAHIKSFPNYHLDILIIPLPRLHGVSERNAPQKLEEHMTMLKKKLTSLAIPT